VTTPSFHSVKFPRNILSNNFRSFRSNTQGIYRTGFDPVPEALPVGVGLRERVSLGDAEIDILALFEEVRLGATDRVIEGVLEFDELSLIVLLTLKVADSLMVGLTLVPTDGEEEIVGVLLCETEIVAELVSLALPVIVVDKVLLALIDALELTL
jgi:hypothetical protein